MGNSLHFGWRVLGITKDEWMRLNEHQKVTGGQHFGARVLATEALTPAQAKRIMADPQWSRALLEGGTGQTAIEVQHEDGSTETLTPEQITAMAARERAVADAETFRDLTVANAITKARSAGSQLLLLLAAEHSVPKKGPRKTVLEALYAEAGSRGESVIPFLDALQKQNWAPKG
jgi:hypothetical protein